MKSNKFKYVIALLLFPLCVTAQVGEHRNNWAIGGSFGYNFNTINFLPKVTQNMHQGQNLGFMVRYTCEKYFTTICSIQAEVNHSQIGWSEDIQDLNGDPVPLTTGSKEMQSYERTLNYIQMPIMAHLAWGKEKGGLNFFINAGPQFGLLISESTTEKIPYKTDNNGNYILSENGNKIVNTAGRASSVCAQDSMKVENKFDYGITAGAGVELSLKKIGRIHIEGRYYYGLGNIFGDTKRDYFACSNHQTITVKFAYLFDL